MAKKKVIEYALPSKFEVQERIKLRKAEEREKRFCRKENEEGL